MIIGSLKKYLGNSFLLFTCFKMLSTKVHLTKTMVLSRSSLIIFGIYLYIEFVNSVNKYSIKLIAHKK
jgi:hypothetical protein